MDVNVGGGGYLIMAQPLENRNTVHAVRIEHGRHCMPKGVRINMRKLMAAAEPLKPFCYTVWMHGFAIILGKNEILILKIFSKPKSFSILPCSILSE